MGFLLVKLSSELDYIHSLKKIVLNAYYMLNTDKKSTSVSCINI